MAAPADYLDAADLKAALAGGLLNEDVLQQVYNLDKGIRTEFTDMVGTDSFSNSYSEWINDDHAAPDINNAVVSGSDASTVTATTATRVGNHAQISQKAVAITTRGEKVDSIGGTGSSAYNVAKKTNELRRDIEAIALGNQASVADDNNTTAGKTAGFGAWIESNYQGGTNSVAGGFNTGTKVVDAPTIGEAQTLAMSQIRTGIESCYNAAANPSVLMSVPAVTKAIGSFLLSSAGAPFRAAPTANISGDGMGTGQTAQGYVDVIVSDFNVTLKIVPNRLQQQYDSTDSTPVSVADVFLIDPEFAALSYLYGYQVTDLAKLGLSDRKQVSTDWMTKVYREDAHAKIAEIDPTQAMTA